MFRGPLHRAEERDRRDTGNPIRSPRDAQCGSNPSNRQAVVKLSQNHVLTPSIQVSTDPALNPVDDLMSVFGLLKIGKSFTGEYKCPSLVR